MEYENGYSEFHLSLNDLIIKDGIALTTKVFDTIDSTNTYLKNELKEKAINKNILVVSQTQLAGRGSGERSFLSYKGGLYMSLAPLKRFEQPSDMLLLTPFVCVCVANAIKKILHKNVKIKWVNDIYYNNKKAGGILCESVYLNEEYRTILGIGLNLSAPENGFDDNSKNATNLCDKISSTDVAKLCFEIVKNILNSIDNIKETDFMQDYRAHSFLLDKRVLLEQNGIKEYVKVIGFTNEAYLIIQTETGIRRTVTSARVLSWE